MELVASAPRFQDLELLIADEQLPKGAKIRVEMQTRLPWVFDAPGAELALEPFIPEEVVIIDVYAEEGKGIADLEVDPPVWLGKIIEKIKTHWWAAAIAGFVLGMIVTHVNVWIARPAVSPIPWILLGAAAVLAVGYAVKAKRGA